MAGKLLLLFIVTPLVELFLLVKLAQLTSFLTTVLVVVATGVIGVFAARVQGWLVWQKIQLDLRCGRVPADGLTEGIILLVAGLLLITPGLLTDCVGFALLMPPLRRAVREWIKRKFREMIERGEGVYVVHAGSVRVEPEPTEHGSSKAPPAELLEPPTSQDPDPSD